MFLKISQNSHTSARVSFFDKVTDWTTENFLKRGSSTGDSCEFCEILKSILFAENHPGNDSGVSLVF